MARLAIGILFVVCFALPGAALVLLGDSETPGFAYSFERAGDVAYVADGPGGLRIHDVSDPRAMREIGAFPALGDVRSVETAALPLLYVAAGADGLRVLDVSDPATPTEVGFLEGLATGVAVRGGLAFVVDDSIGLRVVDVSDPAHPVELGRERTCRNATIGSPSDVSLAVLGETVYIACRTRGLVMVDVSDPAAPRLRRTFKALDLSARDVALRDGIAYLAGGDGGLFVVDVSNPDQPSLLGTLEIPFVQQIPWVRGVDVVGERAYLAAGRNGLRVVDVSSPESPEELGIFTVGGSANDVKIRGDVALLAAAGEGLRAVSVRHDRTPRELAAVELFGVAWDVAVAGGVAHVADGFSGLRLVDVSDPASPVELSRVLVPDRAYGVEVADGIAYVAAFSGGLSIVDVSDPVSPRVIGHLETPDVAFYLDVEDDLVYLPAGRRRKVLVVDVSNPTAPHVISSFGEPPRAVEDVEVQDDIAYVTYRESLVLFDVADPARPVQLSSVTVPNAWRVAVADGTAYVAGPEGVRRFDVTDPVRPLELEPIAVADAWSVHVEGDLVLVTLGPFEAAVLAFDVSDPQAPKLVGGVSTRDEARNVAYVDGLVYAPADAFGLFVFDLGPEYPGPGVIDVEPGSDRNRVRPRSRGFVDVAVLGSDGFRAEEVDAETLSFGPDAAKPAERRPERLLDVNHDGSVDLLVHFRVDETGIDPGDDEVCLTGRTRSGVYFGDCDAIRTLPPPCGFGFHSAFAAALAPLGWLRRRRAKTPRPRNHPVEPESTGRKAPGAASRASRVRARSAGLGRR